MDDKDIKTNPANIVDAIGQTVVLTESDKEKLLFIIKHYIGHKEHFSLLVQLDSKKCYEFIIEHKLDKRFADLRIVPLSVEVFTKLFLCRTEICKN